MFSVGDVLIKVDCRAWVTEDFDTRHHAMLVVDLSETGYPTVAHMKFTDRDNYTGNLVVEPCPKARDLILIHAPCFSEQLRTEIAGIAKKADRLGLLKIERQFLKNEHRQVIPFRWDNSFERQVKLDVLYEEVLHVKNVLSYKEQLISCHDFVLSVIHMACQRCEVNVPRGFDIPPHLAWSDILHEAARQDKTLSLCGIQSIIPGKSTHLEKNARFFSVGTSFTTEPKYKSLFTECFMM